MSAIFTRKTLFLASLATLLAVCTLLWPSCRGKTESPGQAAVDQSAPALSAGQAGKMLVCRKASEAVAVDGRIENLWQAADTLRLDDPADVSDPNQVKIYTLWDNNYLYVSYEVADRYLVGFQTERDHKALYKDDMIEVLLDPRREATDLWLEDDIVYHINVLGQVKDDRGTPGGEVAKSDAGWQSAALFAVQYEGTLNDSTGLDRGFCAELAVPWSEIGLSPAAGQKLGIDFASGDAEGAQEHLWDWCGARPFRQPSVYGTLLLE